MPRPTPNRESKQQKSAITGSNLIGAPEIIIITKPPEIPIIKEVNISVEITDVRNTIVDVCFRGNGSFDRFIEKPVLKAELKALSVITPITIEPAVDERPTIEKRNEYIAARINGSRITHTTPNLRIEVGLTRFLAPMEKPILKCGQPNFSPDTRESADIFIFQR